jgi:hypothetical protein
MEITRFPFLFCVELLLGAELSGPEVVFPII